MAVLIRIPGFEAYILVDGLPLEEYDQPDERTRTQMRVTSHFKRGASEWDLDGKVYINGTYASGRLLYKDSNPQESVFDGSMLRTEDIKEQQKLGKNLGEIRVKFHRGTIGGAARKCTSSFTDAGSVHEKSLKGRAVSYKTSLGDGVPSTMPRFLKFDREPSHGSFGSFRFRYRSINDLKAEMIIPRSPTPILLEDRPIEELSLEGTRELLRRQRAVPKIKPELKRERQAPAVAHNSNDTDELDVLEPSAKRNRRTIETVDLTSE